MMLDNIGMARWISALAGAAAMMLSASAFAEEAHEVAGEAAHESGGLPQFDPTSFPSQIFWLAIVFAVLYTVFSRMSLPAISKAIETRNSKIKCDRDLAEQMANEAKAVMDGYEKSLSDARTESARISADTTQSIKTKAEQSLQAFQKKAEDKMMALESSMESSKHQAMEEMTTIAAEIASAAAQKIVGLSTDINDAKTVVKSLNGKLSKAA